ncbi:peroxynitrite isomerase THAP4 [Engystomops pustulosus]|uniref:peroxynitrite isomerase THAP4 n=1 Tax=Engystomops pustulosus TaxID=76066 RepID=UPI003AFA5393
MVICCAAPNCTNRQGKGKRGAISFHRFPLKDSARLFLWTAAIQRSDWTPGPYSFLCSDHFSEDSFVPRMPDQHPLLKPDAVPSLFHGGRALKRKRAYEPRELRLGKRKHVKTKLASFSLEENRFLVSQAEKFVHVSDTHENCDKHDAVDTRDLLYPCSQHIASSFIFSLHSYSRSSVTPLSQDPITPDSSLNPLDEGAAHTHNLNPKENKLSPSFEHGCGDISLTVKAYGEPFGDNNNVLAAVGQVPLEVNLMDSDVLEPSRYVVQEAISGVQLKDLLQDKDSEVLTISDSVHSYCSMEKLPTGQTQQNSDGELAGEELRIDPLNYRVQDAPPLNPAVAPLAWMLGTWVSDPPGEGEFPSIPSFRYMEEAVISHVGQPMLNFTFCASHADTGKPMHRECGFIRVKPGTKQVAFICAQNTGVVEVEEGEVQGEQLTLTSHSLSRISFAKEPPVQQISRTFRLTPEGKLEQMVSMATSTHAMSPHLRVTYKKVTS